MAETEFCLFCLTWFLIEFYELFILGASDAPVTVPAPKQAETSAPQRSSRGVPKAPTSQHAAVSSDATATTTPKKGEFGGWLFVSMTKPLSPLSLNQYIRRKLCLFLNGIIDCEWIV